MDKHLTHRDLTGIETDGIMLLSCLQCCGIDKTRGGQFLWITKILQVRGDVMFCIVPTKGNMTLKSLLLMHGGC